MRDEDKSKEQLITELVKIRQRMAELETLETEHRRTEELLRQCTAALRARNQDLDDVARYVVSELKNPLGFIIGFAELLEEDYAALSDKELRHCIRMIKQNGHKMNEMVGALLLLANSHRLFDNVWHAAYLAAMGEASLSQWAQEQGENGDVKETYRFTCLPTFAPALVIRVWMTGGETPRFRAIAKLGSDQGGYEEYEDKPSQRQHGNGCQNKRGRSLSVHGII